MGWLKNLRVLYKILILVVVAALGMAAIGFMGWSTIKSSKSGLELVYKEKLQQIDRIGDAKYMMRDMQSRAALAMAAHDQARFEDLRGNIKEIEREYLSDDFIYGNNPRYSIINRKRIENVGDMEARIELKNGIIKDVNIMGDYFLVGDIDNRILYRLRNIPYTREALEAVIPPHVDDIVMNLKRDELIGLLLNS